MNDRTMARFWAKVDKTETCWLWTASTFTAGYGAFSWAGRTSGAHRFAYETFVGPIPEGSEIDHRCHTPSCVNPQHLQVVTRHQNQQNRRGATGISGSGVRGVSWIARERRWRVQVYVAGRCYAGGYYRTLEDAERAAVALRNTVMTNNLIDRAAS
jgi:hypothetical protein